MAFLGIDLGTSFIKAAVLDLDERRLQNARRIPFPEPIPGLGPLRCEFDPQGIVGAVENLIHEMKDYAVQYEGVVMCAQMSCLVLMNQRGEARSNCLGWRDQRALEPHRSGTGSYYEELKRRITAEQRRELGNELPIGAPATFLFWLAEQGELEAGLIPVSLADFVVSTLCSSQPCVESTNAMAYELLCLQNLQWHSEVLKELRLDKLHWPDIRAHGDIVGWLKIGTNTVPCFTPVGDYQCALAGALLNEEELSLNISTGSQVSRLTSDLVLGNYQTRPFFDGKYTNTLSHLPAGRSLNVLVDLLSELGQAQGATLPDPWPYIARAAEAVPFPDLQVRLSFFPGPCGETGAISNIREQNLTVGTLFKAAFENMAENYYQCATRVWPDHSWCNLVFSGGLGRKLKLLRKIIEQRFASESRLCPVEEDTLLGLMVLASKFSGRTQSVRQAMDEFRSFYAAGQASGQAVEKSS